MNLRKDHSHIPASCLCMLRCGHVDDVSYVFKHGQGWWAGLLTAVEQVRLPLFLLEFVFDTVRNFPSLSMAKGIRLNTTSSDGCLGSNNDEGCSEV